ncbi:MAG: hypothetical protein J6K20_00045 [Thermoguttaceae bacterium]|nr:hypothetical protein [Thermoguttaceae bacterium]
MVDEVHPWKQESYVYTDENWKPTPRLDDERYFLIFEIESDRKYFEEYYDGDEIRIEDAIEDSADTELEILKEIESGEIYFKRGYEWCNVRKDYYPCCHSDTAKGDLASNGDLVDAIFATGEDVDELRIYVDMKTGALFYDYGMRRYELVEAEKVRNENEWDYEYLNERKLGPKVYAHFMGQDAADEAFKHLNEGVETNA